MEHITTSIDQLIQLYRENHYVANFAALVFLTVLATFANFVVKRLLLRVIFKILSLTKYGHDRDIMEHNVIARLANVVPALIVIMGISLIPDIPDQLNIIVRNVASAFIILTIALALGEALVVANALYQRRPDAANKPIKGYLQVIKIAIYVIAAILIVAALIDKSPLILLSGLGAMAAVLMLVFQDTLLSLVASVQISSSDMVRVGDWIEMPELRADGNVIDVALHTVKVQNWDKTITTLPTRRLVSEPFKNWRGMQESGGRRIKRALYLDQNSIHFLKEDEKDHLRKFTLLSDYLDNKDKELTQWNAKLGENNHDPVNTRRLTNVGTFRAYVLRYLESHDKIRSDMTMLVRQLAPGPDGLPLEIYCFTNTTAWASYEDIQSDIFDHLYAVLPEFGLQAYQQPSGRDLQKIGFGIKALENVPARAE